MHKFTVAIRWLSYQVQSIWNQKDGRIGYRVLVVTESCQEFVAPFFVRASQAQSEILSENLWRDSLLPIDKKTHHQNSGRQSGY